MRKAILILLMALVLVIPAYAADGDSIPDTSQDEAQFVVSTWEELQIAVDNAEDGDAITLADGFIQIPNGATLGSADKHIVIQLSDQYADMYKESALLVFNMGEQSAYIQNITFNGNDIPANNMVFLCCDATIYGCDFINCKTTFDTSCIRISNISANIVNCAFSNNYGTGSGAIDIAQGGNVEIDNCRFLNNFGLQGGVVHNNGTVEFGANYFKDNASEYGGHIAYNYGEIEINLNMEDYKSLYGYIPKGWYIDSIFEDRFTTVNLEEWEPVDFSFTDQFCCLAFDSDDSIPDTPPEQPQPPQEPTQPPEGEGTDNPDNPDSGDQDAPQQPEQPPQGGNEDEPTDTPPQTPEQPEEPPQGDTTDKPTDTTPDTPQPPQKPSDGDSSGDDNYTPPVDNRPSQRPIWPVVTVKPTEDNKPQDQPENDPAPAKPQLACNGAVIDTSRTVVLLGYGDSLLHEGDPLTRAQLATIIYRLLDDESIALYSNTQLAFTDVTADAWYAPFVQTINGAGIVQGVGNSKYDPNGAVTWAQIITILTRFVEPQKFTLQHIQYQGWAEQAIQTAVARGWIEDSVDFTPDAVIGRGELEQFINGVLALYR